jgi:hypothetical protein
MGRPKLKAGEKRALFTIRFSRDEVKSYKKAAGANKMILRKWMRKVLNEAAGTAKPADLL